MNEPKHGRYLPPRSSVIHLPTLHYQQVFGILFYYCIHAHALSSELFQVPTGDKTNKQNRLKRIGTLQLPILPPLQFIQKLFLNNCHGRLCYYLVDYLFNLYRLAREDPGASRGLDGMDVTCLHSIFHCTDCRPCHAMLRSLPRLRVVHACNNPCMQFSQCTFIRETHLLSLKIET